MDIAKATSLGLPNRSESSEPLPESQREGSSRLIERLFARFAAVYGAKFANAWAGADPEDMKRAWSERLERFDLRQVGRALELCETTLKYPPTLPEFIEIVRSCYEPTHLAIGHVSAPRPHRSDAEIIAGKEYPKPANGFGVFWACQIVRLAQLGAYPHADPLRIALQVLGLKNVNELAASYPPARDKEAEAERAALEEA